MKCPFTPGECMGRECPGWSLGSCFLEIFIQKMDNISLKLDTLCNLTSLTVVSNAAAGKPSQPEPVKPSEADPIKESIEKEARPVSNESTFWKFPGIAPKPERRAANQHRDPTVRSRAYDLSRGPEKPLESQVQERAKQPAVETQKEVLPVDAPHTVLAEAHDNSADRETIQDEKPVLEFPAKVSEIVFGDETEARVTDALRVAQSIEPQELTLELTPVEELASEVHEGLAVSERVLLMAQPANESGTIDVMVDDLPHDSDAEWPFEQKEAAPQEAESSALDVMSTANQKPVASTEDAAERAAAPIASDVLSVERVIDDITSIEEPAKIPDEPAATVMEPEVALSDLSMHAEPAAEADAVAEGATPVPAVETLREPIQDEEAMAAAQQPDLTAVEAAPMADAEAEARETEPIEDAPSPEPRPVLRAVPFQVAADVSLDNAPEADEQPSAPAEEAISAAEAGTWQPIGAVQADGRAFLGIDFGAAFSKVALKMDPSSPATPVPLSLMAYEILQKAGLVDGFENRSEYAEESLVYCDHNEFVFCGMLAKKLSLEAAETGQNRPAIQNLKTFLVRGGANLQIHSDFFPGSESLDSQSVLAIYLAYLLRLTRHYLNNQTGTTTVDLDSTIRNFSIPTWIEERYREDVKRLFRGAAAYAFCLERWLKDDLIKGARLPEVRKALQEAHDHKGKIEETLVGSIVTESVAAGQARLLSLANDKTRPLTVLVINVGAGFTDFALFTLGHADGQNGNTTTRVAHRGGVGTGLGVWDNALKTLLFNRVREAPAARRKTDEFRRFKARLELQAREIKEALLASDEALPVDISPVFQEPLVIDKSELENSLPVKAALFGIRDGLRVFIKEAIKALGMHRFDPAFTEIIVTGGGAFLPSVVDCIREGVATLGPAYPSRVRSDYVSPLYASITDIGRLYPLLAVSLGVTEKECLEEDATPARTAAAPSPNQEIMPAVSLATAQNGQNGRPRSTHEVKIPTKRTGRFRLS